MYDYSYNSANKRGLSEDVTYLPTAEKDKYAPDNEPYFERTPEKQFTSPRR